MISAIRRYLPSTNAVVMGGSCATIALAIALKLLEPKKLKIEGETLDEQALAERAKGFSKLTLSNCTINPSDENNSQLTLRELDIDKLYSLPTTRCTELTLRGAHVGVPAFVRSLRASHVRLKNWEGMNYDDLRGLSREWSLSLELGNEPERFKALCTQLPENSQCRLTLTDPKILDGQGVGLAMGEKAKFARITIGKEIVWSRR